MIYILLGAGFEECEALVTADVLRRAGLPVTLAGVEGRTVTGSHGITVQADLPAAAVALNAGDMLILPGGLGGVSAMERSPAAMGLIRQAADSPDLWLAAICAAPTLLARAGLLPRGVHAVCYPGMEGELSAAGAIPVMDRPVVAEGRLITGRAAGSAFDFGLAIVEMLAGTAKADQVRAGIHYGE